MSKIGDWERVGVVPVDTGRIWMVDPCNVPGGVVDDLPGGGGNGEAFALGAGVCTYTGLGDGGYEVFVRYVTLPFWGKRVAEVKIVFIDEDQLEERPDDR